MSFGERLRAARDKAGLTQEALGVGLGTDGKDAGKQVVHGWEKNKHFPRVDQLLLICQRVGVTPNDLLIEDGSTLSMKSLNGLEGNLISMFRQLTEGKRDEVLGHVNSVLAEAATAPSPAAPFFKVKAKSSTE